MKPGDLVEFKDGLFGIAAPLNFGIYLSRERQGRNYFAILYTVKGKKEVKTDHLKGVRLSAPLSGDQSEEDLKSRLETLLGEAASQAKQQAVAAGEINDRDVWRKVNMLGEALTPEEMAASFYETKAPSKSQVESIRAALASCQRPGVGYFERAPDRIERWRPLPSLAYRDVKRDIEAYNGLRKKLILIEEVPPEDEWTPPKTVYHGVPLAEAGLTEEDHARLQTIKRAMEDFVLHDRWTGNVGLAGTPVHTIDGFRLMDYLKWLAYDWTGAARVSVSSAFVEFLMATGLANPGDSLLLTARRKVLAHPDFEWDTPADVMRAAERVPDEVVPEAKVGRVDLTQLATWTIDPADAKDHDDAVSYRENPDGTTTLWVHIADVSHYVQKETTLDHDARKRATSVYLPTGVLPMLPPKLSDGLCSLNEGVDRLALTAILTYDKEGSLVKEEFVEALIRVSGNVSYEQVLAQIEQGDPANEFVRMEAFARKLDAKRRGLVLETGERRVRIREGQVVHQIKQGNAATKMIEVFMVAANEAVARKLTAEGVPVLYRCHPLPDRSSVERFNGQMLTMQLPIEIMLPPPEDVALKDAPAAPGAPAAAEAPAASILDQLKSGGKLQLFGGGLVATDEPEATPGEEAEAIDAAPPPLVKGFAQLTHDTQEAYLDPFRDALSQVETLRDPRKRELVYLKTLGCMGRAIYTTRNIGHFGLGSECYCHFTSPIRRYPDLIVHRQLRWILRGKQGEMPHTHEGLDILAVHCSDQGAAAEGLERSVVDSAMVFISRDGSWEGVQPGQVNGITRGGVFLSLPRGLEARLAASDLPGGPYDVDEHDSMLFLGSASRTEMQEEVTAKNWRELYNEARGEVVKVRVRLGDELAVTIAGRDYVEGRVAAKLSDST